MIHLSPNMPALSEVSVPPLHTNKTDIPDAEMKDTDLTMEATDAFEWIVEPGNHMLVNLGASAPSLGNRVALTVWDWLNRPVVQRNWAVPFSESLRFQIEQRGTYLLTLDRFSGESVTSRLTRSFSVCPSNLKRQAQWETDAFFVGVCAFPDRMHWKTPFGERYPKGISEKDAAAKEADLSARLGMQVVRLNAGNEAAFDLYASRGIRPYLQVGQHGGPLLPRYADIQEGKWRYPTTEEFSRKAYADVAKQFGDRPLFYEINNEMDNLDFWRGTPEEFIQSFESALEAFAKHAPGIRVLNGGYTFMEKEMTKAYVQAFADKIDWVAIHSHGSLNAYQTLMAECRRMHEEAGHENPVFVNTEMGNSSWRLDFEALVAGRAIRKILYSWAEGLRGVMVYRVRDQGGPRLSVGADAAWGYLDHDFCPRFKYGALAALIDWFAGARFESVLAQRPDLHAYLFRVGDRRLAVAFHPECLGPEGPVVFESDAATVRTLDAMGNPTEAPNPSRVTVTPGIYPAIVLFDGASSVRLAE